MKKHGLYFRIFLIVYLVFLIFHATEFEWRSWRAVTGLAVGITLALLAHLRHGYGMIVLLIIHMGIEWSEYAQQGASYSAKGIAFYCLHTALDFAFLWEEVKAHLYKYRHAVMAGTVLSIAIYFSLMYQPHPTTSGEQGSNTIETMVIGGILGCTLSHLLARKKAEQNLQH